MSGHSRILAIDYGQKRVGIAISDPLGFTAQGLETIEGASSKELIAALGKICSEWSVGEVVVGFPVNMNGSLGPKAEETNVFIEKLKAGLTVPVTTWDERLTSREAGRLMIEERLSRKKQRSQSDRIAATLILQNYLEARRSRAGGNK